jgi:GDP-4-dehydro-6-deoxy-D-mannose reductase
MNPNDPGDYSVIDLRSMDAVMGQNLAEFDFVVHLAGLAAVGPSFDNPREYIDTNAGMQINLFEALSKQKASPRVLIISTGGVYGASKTPITEKTGVVASNPYVISKLTQEMLARYYAKKGFNVMVARPFNHIGPGQGTGFIASDFAKQIAEIEKNGDGVLRVGNLVAKRDYTDVRDIVAGYYQILTKGKPGAIYNVCSGISRSGKDILDGLLAHSKAKIEVQIDQDKMRPTEVMNVQGSHHLLTVDTGWEPSIELGQTLKDVLEDWRQRVAAS